LFPQASSFAKVLDGLEEVRCIVKKKSSEKKRYKVKLQVKDKRHMFAFSEDGYDVAEIFDSLVLKAKNNISKALGQKKIKESIRKFIE
jgi:hypothetical protein